MNVTNLKKSVIFVIKEMDRYLITKRNMVLMTSLVFTATKSSIYIYKANFTAMKLGKCTYVRGNTTERLGHANGSREECNKVGPRWALLTGDLRQMMMINTETCHIG